MAFLGAPLQGLSIEDLAGSELIFQIGIPPIRIHIITSVDGVDFEAAWQERISSEYADQGVHVLSRRHRIESKKASGRLQDLADVEFLEKGERG